MQVGSSRFEKITVACFCALAILGTLVLISALSYVSGGDAQKRRDSPLYHAETSRFYAQRDCGKLTQGELFDCIFDRIEAGQANAQTEQDLTAQQRAALGALIAAISGVASIIVSILGLVFIRNTLDETRKTFNLTKSTSVAELRPWVSISATPDFFEMDGHRIEIGFTVEFKNIGRTVAESVKTHLRTAFLDGESTNHIDQTFRTWRLQKNKMKAVIIPGDQEDIPHRTIQSFSAVKWSTLGDAIFVLIASVRYTDPLDGTEHWTEQSFSVGRNSDNFMTQRYLSKDMVGMGVKDIKAKRFRSGSTS